MSSKVHVLVKILVINQITSTVVKRPTSEKAFAFNAKKCWKIGVNQKYLILSDKSSSK